MTATSKIARCLRVRNKELRFGTRTYLMGIVNASPDSFSGDGCASSAQALELALQHIKSGADIIDIGGQSTRTAGFTGLPGYMPVDEQAELERVLPVIAELGKRNDTIISVDTFSPYVLEKCLQTGADILNSIWGLEESRSGINLPKSSPHTDLVTIVAEYKCPVIIMHNKTLAKYPNGVVSEVKEYLIRSVHQAVNAGISEEAIILDPGIGFAKTPEQNIELLSNLNELTALGFPVLLGTSRKSFIGKLTDKDPQDRIYGTAATIALGIQAKVDIMRVHDVAQMSDCIKVADAIVRRT